MPHGGSTRVPKKGLCSKANSREVVSVLYQRLGFKNSGLMLEFGFLVGKGRSWVMIGRLCLDMVAELLVGDKLLPDSDQCHEY